MNTKLIKNDTEIHNCHLCMAQGNTKLCKQLGDCEDGDFGEVDENEDTDITERSERDEE